MSADKHFLTATKSCNPGQYDHVPKEVDHTGQISKDIGNLFSSDDFTDVKLIVDGEIFHVHKIILACRSEYFRALFFSGLSESQSFEVELKDINGKSFYYLLMYIYTGKLNLLDIKEDAILDLLGLAHQFNFVQLETALSEFLKASLTHNNIALVYNLATAYSLSSLCSTCLEFLDRNASKILESVLNTSQQQQPIIAANSPEPQHLQPHQQQVSLVSSASAGFLSLSRQALVQLISRDSFFADECQIFNAVRAWCLARPPNELTPVEARSIYACLRLELISLSDLLHTVRPSGQISPDALLDAIQEKNARKDCELRYRGILLPEENLATIRHGAQVTKGECRVVLLDGDTVNYDLDRGFTRHPIDDKNGCIVVKLGQPSIINLLRLLLWDKDTRSYSYYIEVSINETDWVQVIDHRAYLCRSWQELYFPERVVRYIRIVGTHNTVNRVFHCVALEAFYTRRQFVLTDGLITPEENVATVAKSACVIEGVSRLRNALINGDTKNYDWDSGYTCHQLGNGAIVVQLSQPYYIGSMQLLLWDLDQRAYSYTVDTSCDQTHWDRVWDASRTPCRSWQVTTFSPRPVVFVRIIGTMNTANEVFHVVHFQCPCEPQALRDHLARQPPPLQQQQQQAGLPAASGTSAAATVAAATYEGDGASSVEALADQADGPASRSSSLVSFGHGRSGGAAAAATAMAASAAPSGSQQQQQQQYDGHPSWATAKPGSTE
ncbi:hypothetical protein BOX15_Mlig010289g1 [Macrostomum lignano]|uniref:BTB domain-containing protein n=2 Tax=Macrostomum lignano TaxID=282301 RepID=A0A267GUQ4_9PLAT|nr:hypothetical protein BOX15_Mlig010289g1 [Macrostomum lignano]